MNVSPAPADADPDSAVTVDELAHRAGIPVRTVREYQTMGLLPPPERHGRVGFYRPSHLRRLQLIARMQARGYSLAGIRDLLASWRDGSDLAETLGLEADQLVHLDEPGAPATLSQLRELLPALVPDHLDELLDTGAVEACGPDRYCIPSPSLLQLTVDAIAAGYPPERVVTLLAAIGHAATLIAEATAALLTDPPATLKPRRLTELAQRCRGLLAHGTGRLAIHTLGRRLGVTDGTPRALSQALHDRPLPPHPTRTSTTRGTATAVDAGSTTPTAASPSSRQSATASSPPPD